MNTAMFREFKNQILNLIYESWKGSRPVGSPSPPFRKDGSKFINKLDIKKTLGDNLIIVDSESPIIKKHLEELQLFSKDILTKLKNSGTKWFIGDRPITELNSNQHLKGVEPRGWPEGSTWEMVGAMYASIRNEACIGSGRSGSKSSIGHETGHAIMEKLIDMNTFTNIDFIHKKYFDKFYPFYQTGGRLSNAGAEEMFAESVANVINYRLNSNDKKGFPKSYLNCFSTESTKIEREDFTNNMNSIFRQLGI